MPDGKMPRGLNSLGQPYTVLIVDDSVFIQRQLSQILTSENFKIIDTAIDGAEGVEKYKKYNPDIVTLDITMPNVDGLTALCEIVKFDSDAKVIMVSALGKEDLVKKALMSGAKNYIVKPFDREKVLSRVSKIVSR